MKKIANYNTILILATLFFSSLAYGTNTKWTSSYCVDAQSVKIAGEFSYALNSVFIEDLKKQSDFNLEKFLAEFDNAMDTQNRLEVDFFEVQKNVLTVVANRKKLSVSQACAFVDKTAAYFSRTKLNKLQLYNIDQVDFILIYQYTTQLFDPLNKALRSKKSSEALNLLTNRLDIALKKIPSFAGIVYRGSNLPESVINNLSVGSLFTDPAFLSSSRSSGFTGDYTFIIKSKSGRQIEDLSATPDEYEVLFQRGTKFVITSMYTKLEYSEEKNYIEMEEL